MAERGDNPVLELRDLTLKFGGLTVLDGVSLSLQGGELLALIGPNGAGKTSILNCVSGLYRIQSGQMLFGGEDIRGLAPHNVAKRGIARTFQHAELFPQMSVIDNLLIGRHASIGAGTLAQCLFLPSVRREEIAQREAVEEIIDFVELERYRHKPVGSLPFGIQKIVGFARALSSQPKVLLLDEPCAGLNREDREDMARHIMRIQHEKRLPMIWVEHDMQMVADLAERIYVLNYGKLLAQGDPVTVLADPQVIEAYIGHSAPAKASTAIDREHQIQTSLLYALDVAMAKKSEVAAVQDILAQLADYNRAHFASEELLMRLYEYPEFELHSLDHRRMVQELEAIGASYGGGDHEVAAQGAAQLSDFLLQHIASRDRRFSRFLADLGLAQHLLA